MCLLTLYSSVLLLKEKLLRQRQSHLVTKLANSMHARPFTFYPGVSQVRSGGREGDVIGSVIEWGVTMPIKGRKNLCKISVNTSSSQEQLL